MQNSTVLGRPGVLEEDAVDVEGVEFAGAVLVHSFRDAAHEDRELGLVVLATTERASRRSALLAMTGGYAAANPRAVAGC